MKANIDTLQKPEEILVEENQCKDFDEDCPGNGGPTNCWLYDPCKGWCPLISKQDQTD